MDSPACSNRTSPLSGPDDAARPACGYARQRFLHTPGDLAVRIDAVPIALERLPHADILHAELVLQQTHGVRKSFGEAAWIRTERAQRAILPIDIGPSIVKQHSGYWYVLATEFLHFGDDCPFADVLPERIPRTPSKPGKFLRECALGTHADMRPCDGSAHAFMDGPIWIIGHGGNAQHPIQPGEAHRVGGRPQPQPSVGSLPNRHGYYPRALPASRTTYRRSATAKAGSVRECQRTSAPISDASTIPCAGTKTECSRRAARRRRNRPRPRRTDYTCPAPETVQHDARAGRHVRGRARRIRCSRKYRADHHGAARAQSSRPC